VDALAAFHPAVRTWFAERFPEGPTEPQAEGWPAIASGGDTLIAAPTGSGKTLAAFLVAIDRLLGERASAETVDDDAVEVVYVSPLKALAADIHENLQIPLAGIKATALQLGLPARDLRVLLRTGDTASSARAAMVKRPPHLLVTTPESLYLMVTAGKSREGLRRVRAVIVDEIHAVARDKRGAHLALTLARLDALCDRRPQRIGLSATQRPIEAIARLLIGVGEGRIRDGGAPACRIIDLGHRRALDLAIELPETPLEAVASHEQWAEILDKIAAHVAQHRTTLVFVNTRRLAERLAHLLASASARTAWPRITAASRRTGGSSWNRGCARATSRCSSRRRRSSWASTSAPSSWSARSARREASPRSSSAWGARATPAAPSRRAGCSPPRATSSSKGRRSCAACARESSIACSPPRRRSTSSRSRSSRRVRPRRGARTISTRWSAERRPTLCSIARISTPSSRCCRTASRPAVDGAGHGCTATGSTVSCARGGRRASRQ